MHRVRPVITTLAALGVGAGLLMPNDAPADEVERVATMAMATGSAAPTASGGSGHGARECNEPTPMQRFAGLRRL